MQLDLQPAFVLHSKPYRETSLLLTVFSQSHGKLSLIAKGAKRPRSPWQSALQLFQPLLISARGKNELLTLTHAETQGNIYPLKAEKLFSGFYANELLVRLLTSHDEHAAIYHAYHDLLELLLQEKNSIQVTLRLFEKTVLAELGYGLPLAYETQTGQAIIAEAYYDYDPILGVHRYIGNDYQQPHIFHGQSLLDFSNETFTQKSLRDAKRLIRLALSPLLGNKPLKSREMFLSLK